MRSITHNFQRFAAMFTTLALAFVFCFAFAMPASAAQYFGSRPVLNVQDPYAYDHVLIEFAPGVTDVNQKAVAAAADPLFLTIDPTPVSGNTHNAYIDDQTTVEQVVALGYTSPDIVSIQLDTHYYLGDEKVVGFDYGFDGIYETSTVSLGNAVAPIATPYLAGYTFNGWYTDDGVRYDFNAPVNGDMWLTANWILNEPAAPVAAPVASDDSYYYYDDTVSYVDEPVTTAAPAEETTPVAAAPATETITDNATPLAASPRTTAAAVDTPDISVEPAQANSTWMLIVAIIGVIALVAAGLTVYSVVRSRKNREEA